MYRGASANASPTFFGQKHGCTVLTTMRTEVGWISRYLFHSLITTNAPFTKDVSEWVLTLPTAAAIRDMLVTQEMWKNFRSNLVEDVLAASPRASNRDRVEASRREPARHNGTAVSKRVALFMGAEANRAKAEEKVPAVLKKAQDDLAEKQKAEARRAMAYRSAHLAHRLKQRASGRDTSRRASASKPPPLPFGAPASDDDDDSDVPSGDDDASGAPRRPPGPPPSSPSPRGKGRPRGSTSPKRDRPTPASPGKRPPTPDAKNVADRNSLFDAEETTDRLVTMLPFRHPGDQTHQFRPNVKGAPSAHQVALKLSIAPKDQLQCYPELVDDLPTPFAYDSMPDTRLHPHSVIVRKKRVRARRAFVRADWNIREEDHAEAVLMDEAQGTAAAHQRQRRTDVNQTFYDRRATNALVKRKTFSMASHGITNHRMTQKRESTLH